MQFAENFEEIVSAFQKCNVDFILCGGFAVNLHGYNRNTSDLDLWINPIIENKEKVFNALLLLKFSKEQASNIDDIDFTKPFAFKIGYDPIDIDVFNYITGVKYADAGREKVEFIYSDTLKVYYISLKDLILNKMLAGRPKDKLDVEELQRIIILKKENNI